ncbi:MAG: hypothetical protein NC820_07040 [Candidatus Omnitrophica bacterium]|nr:hypothetical protein [Candidatus Omnitrophota bacterium]
MDILDRDINIAFKEFTEQVYINYVMASVVDPYTNQPISGIYLKLPLMVSWHDVTTRMLDIDSEKASILGILTPGDAYCIYQGNLNLFDYQLIDGKVRRRNIDYVIKSITNPSGNRWIIYLKRVK